PCAARNHQKNFQKNRATLRVAPALAARRADSRRSFAFEDHLPLNQNTACRASPSCAPRSYPKVKPP
ncbi:hypothetical protein A2U01_0089289, partial [Trifolium medium]|nr:hypothetical protein [Trifolium medium]